MTSVPKPLKFLRQHYETIKAVHDTIRDPETKVYMFRILFFGTEYLSFERKYCMYLYTRVYHNGGPKVGRGAYE